VRLVQVEYAQGWLASPTRGKQADWRTDPAQAGAGAIGDIGTHAFHLAGFVSGLTVAELAADLSSMVPGRAVDDDARILLRFHGGARGMLWASQVAVGNENGLRLRIFGTEGALDWHQENPNILIHDRQGQPRQILTRGGAGVPVATRTPSGHPEGYLEAFATLYAEAAALIRGTPPATPLPGIADGLVGMRFIAACQASSRANAAWVPMGD
jgi:predicted dehydrogenase